MNYSAAICYFPKITLVRTRNLLARFSDPKNAFHAELDDLVEIGFDPEVAHEFITWRESADVKKITDQLLEAGVKTVSIFDNDYPALLKEITDPPPVLFFRGTLPKDGAPSIGVVGTRKCTVYGKQSTHDIAFELAQNGVTIISGLALGIDGIAHEAALEAKGKTVAVLGSGVGRKYIYPATHQSLAEQIISAGGCVLSEYPPNFEPTQYSFPARNRIIAGLSQGTLVAEAPLKSGALITAERCIDYNRDVFAIPHPINSTQGAGGNNLLKKGAFLVSEAADILKSLEITSSFKSSGFTKKSKPSPTDPLESQICDLLQGGPKQIDEIIKQSGLPSGQITGKLTIMEMRGLIQNLGGMTYNLI